MILWPWGLYRIEGHSMLPTYSPGDTLLGWRWPTRPQIGQVVVARLSEQPLVKRVTHIDGQLVWLTGDNPADSTDSRHFGPININQIESIILVRLP